MTTGNLMSVEMLLVVCRERRRAAGQRGNQQLKTLNTGESRCAMSAGDAWVGTLQIA